MPSTHSYLKQLTSLGEWEEKYRFLIDIGNELATLSSDIKNNEYLVEGCSSKVWLKAQGASGRLHINLISRSQIINGMLMIMIEVLGDKTYQEIIDFSPEYFKSIGLHELLTPTRINGLYEVIKEIKRYALAYQHTEDK